MAPIHRAGQPQSRHKRLYFAIAEMAAAATLAIVLLHLEQNQPQIPYHTSALTGRAWVRELLNFLKPLYHTPTYLRSFTARSSVRSALSSSSVHFAFF